MREGGHKGEQNFFSFPDELDHFKHKIESVFLTTDLIPLNSYQSLTQVLSSYNLLGSNNKMEQAYYCGGVNSSAIAPIYGDDQNINIKRVTEALRHLTEIF